MWFIACETKSYSLTFIKNSREKFRRDLLQNNHEDRGQKQVDYLQHIEGGKGYTVVSVSDR